MKHKVAELEGALLDAAVAKADGQQPHRIEVTLISDAQPRYLDVPAGTPGAMPFAPSQEWSTGGPIIERERISVLCSSILNKDAEPPHHWIAKLSCDWWDWTKDAGSGGDTPLIAAMRAYVASKFGDEVELP